MRRIVTSLLVLGMAACGGADGDAPPRGDPYIDLPPLWNDYVLGFGETINLRESVGIEFVDVLEDSRCPTNLTCIDACNARVLIKGLTPRGTFLVTAGEALLQEVDLLGSVTKEWGTHIATGVPGATTSICLVAALFASSQSPGSTSVSDTVTLCVPVAVNR